ncbi:MAG TPA: CocE/NonD family hydrolase [Puia sp.]|nr:CocE/NonD family hydrolase [Puia sp.]
MKHLLFLLLLLYAEVSIAQDSTWIKGHYYKIERYITMRDGIQLFTSMYIPKDSTEKHPILLTRTPYSCAPYGENNWRTWWNRFQREYFKGGYIIVTQDIRGRYMSEGDFYIIPPYIKNKKTKSDIDEASDAYDAIDWLVKNVPGNNGKVGVVGISYPGFCSTEAALSGHPALLAVSAQAPTTDAFMGDDVHHNGAFFLEDTYGFLVEFGIGKPRPAPTTENAVGIPPFTADAYDFYLRMGALSNMTKIVEKNNIRIWGEIMQHPDYDAWWKARNTRVGLYGVKPAMMEVGGLFDAEDCFGAWNVYKAIEKQSPATHNKLVIGPWFHGQWASPDGTHLGNVRFGSNTSVWFQQKREIPFFNYYLKGEGNLDSMAKATVFFTGENEWHAFSVWPPENTRLTNLYLQEKDQLGFAMPVTMNNPDEYVSDPSKPVPYTEGIHDDRTREYMTDDQRFTANRTDVLVYKTDTLKDDLTIAGPITADLKVSVSTTDADFVVKLIDIFPDNFEYKQDAGRQQPGYVMNGYQMLVRGDVMRGRYRNSFEKPEAFVPGKTSEVKFSMNDVAHTFKKGHRIMVQIQSSWFPLVDRNPQKFVNIYTCTDQDFQKAAIRIYHDAANASFLVFPVLR